MATSSTPTAVTQTVASSEISDDLATVSLNSAGVTADSGVESTTLPTVNGEADNSSDTGSTESEPPANGDVIRTDPFGVPIPFTVGTTVIGFTAPEAVLLEPEKLFGCFRLKPRMMSPRFQELNMKISVRYPRPAITNCLAACSDGIGREHYSFAGWLTVQPFRDYWECNCINGFTRFFEQVNLTECEPYR